MNFPKILAKITKHNPPRHMLYQPGFNNGNSCWLRGSWIRVTPEEWEEHKDLYIGIREWAKDQYYKNKGIAIKNMSPAQKRAYEFYSGDETFDCLNKRGYHHVIRVEMGGRFINDKSVAWMRKNGFKIIERVTHYGKSQNQLRGFKNIPEDLIFRNEKPIDTVKMTIGQNKGKDALIFLTLLDFNLDLAMGNLIQIEEDIIRTEWHRKYKKDFYDDLDSDVKEYVRRRKLLRVKCGEDFETIHYKHRESHNSSARHNLKSNCYSYVLPVFHDDGTHEPWSEGDVPVPEKM